MLSMATLFALSASIAFLSPLPTTAQVCEGGATVCKAGEIAVAYQSVNADGDPEETNSDETVTGYIFGKYLHQQQRSHIFFDR